VRVRVPETAAGRDAGSLTDALRLESDSQEIPWTVQKKANKDASIEVTQARGHGIMVDLTVLATWYRDPGRKRNGRARTTHVNRAHTDPFLI
jgi:hypothetical protein